MKDWEDKEQLKCIACGHRWILISDKEITGKQHNLWAKNALKQHAEISEEKKK